MRTLTFEDGNRVGLFRQPPPQFDPFEASAAQRRMYGLPALPQQAPLRERYRRLYEQVARGAHFVEPVFRTRPSVRGLPAGPALNVGPETFASSTIAGTVVSAPAGDSFHWMQGDWIVPNLSAPGPGAEYACASWIGLGGSGVAFQAGVHASLSSGQSELLPFWEWITPGQGLVLDITSLSVRPGDLVSVILCTTQGAGSTEGTLFFLNRTNASHTSIAVYGPPLAASTAQWGVGFPFLWGGDASLLADYGEVFFSNCDAVTNGQQLVGGGSGDLINLTSDGSALGSIVSDCSAVTSQIVLCRYLGPVP
jgi:hypothetical protein